MVEFQSHYTRVTHSDIIQYVRSISHEYITFQLWQILNPNGWKSAPFSAEYCLIPVEAGANLNSVEGVGNLNKSQ